MKLILEDSDDSLIQFFLELGGTTIPLDSILRFVVRYIIVLRECTNRGDTLLTTKPFIQLDITQAWGNGETSSSDGQRFAMRRRVLQQTYSPKFNDFALEFYSFVADNYAPFYSSPIECTDRDAPYVLDGLLYNESDLPLEEHYTDTHGYIRLTWPFFRPAAEMRIS